MAEKIITNLKQQVRKAILLLIMFAVLVKSALNSGETLIVYCIFIMYVIHICV